MVQSMERVIGVKELKHFLETHAALVTPLHFAKIVFFALLPVRHGTPVNPMMGGVDEEGVLYLCNRASPAELTAIKELPPPNPGGTYVRFAASHGMNRVISKLVEEYGMALEEEGEDVDLPISVAARYGHKETVEYLWELMLARGWKEKDICSRGELVEKAVLGDNTEMLAAMVEKARKENPSGWFLLRPDHFPDKDLTMALVAVTRGCLHSLRWLLTECPETFNVNDEAAPLLHFACFAHSNQVEIIQFLVERGADVLLRNHEGLLASQSSRPRSKEVADYLKQLEDAEMHRREHSVEQYLEQHAPDGLKCPISLQLFVDPVILVGDGCTYSRSCIERHLSSRQMNGLPTTSPTTNMVLHGEEDVRLVENLCVRGMLLQYTEEKSKEWGAVQ